MCDFDGTTGFDLYERLNDYDKKYLMSIAIHYCTNKVKHTKKKKGGLF